MSLTKEEIEERRNGIGGSDAIDILSGNWAELYLIKKGLHDKSFDSEERFRMDMGTAVEPVIREYWHAQQTEEMAVGANMFVQSEISYMRANVDTVMDIIRKDGFDRKIQEIKFHTGMKSIEELAEYYYGQIQHNIFVAGVHECHFTVGFGAWGKYADIVVPRDDEFLNRYLELCEKFWWHVENDTPPENQDIEEIKPKVEWTKKTSYEGNNSWASAAADWIENKEAAGKFEASKKSIKECMAEDDAVAYGHGVQAKRDKNGAVRISEMKNGDIEKLKKEAKEAA